jgi:hypothetical protein
MAGDARTLIEQAVRRLLEEVPALKPLKLVVGVDLIGGRSDLQSFRLELPAVDVRKDLATDARVRVEMRREHFNPLAEDGTLTAWHKAYDVGRLKATGVQQYLQLIGQVVAKEEERRRLRKARHGA